MTTLGSPLFASADELVIAISKSELVLLQQRVLRSGVVVRQKILNVVCENRIFHEISFLPRGGDWVIPGARAIQAF